ncbi:hypothetical protein [Vreelandella jeotgali]|uniref:hypothetical protein n=1 Tax=Vreelandella jeotgali TaxID=553386 RepID=UPI0012EAEAF0|nr:hypothetical protein [Halomonas jeotgali]
MRVLLGPKFIYIAISREALHKHAQQNSEADGSSDGHHAIEMAQPLNHSIFWVQLPKNQLLTQLIAWLLCWGNIIAD